VFIYCDIVTIKNITSCIILLGTWCCTFICKDTYGVLCPEHG